MRTDARRNRDAIVGAARELVARDGDEVRMDAVAERAGVAVGTIYRHFPTKADLVAAVVGESVERIAGLVDAALARTDDGSTAWEELTWFFTALDDGHSAGRAVRMAADLLGLEPGPAVDREPSASATSRRARAGVGALLARAQDAGDMRRDVTLPDLFMLMAQAPGRDRPELRARYVEIVKSGLRPETPQAEASAPRRRVADR